VAGTERGSEEEPVVKADEAMGMRRLAAEDARGDGEAREKPEMKPEPAWRSDGGSPKR
jgi:hypothetical protein